MRSVRTLKLTLAFDGTGYAGWQRQKLQTTIQQVLEEKLSLITKKDTKVEGAGRTDAGVHALGMVASLRTDSSVPLQGLLKGLNSMLPPDIRILRVEEKEADFHARYSAMAKAYEYRMVYSEFGLPTERLYSLRLPAPLNLAEMQRCLDMLVGEHDFSSFEASGSREHTPGKGRGAVRRILSTDYVEDDSSPKRATLTFVGDGFLRHMVRNIVGTLIEVGRGRRSAADFAEIMAARDRSAAGPTAPSHGLFLREVYYDLDRLGGS